jgi:hypothetical protein
LDEGTSVFLFPDREAGQTPITIEKIGEEDEEQEKRDPSPDP